jgi:hypothetical protein
MMKKPILMFSVISLLTLTAWQCAIERTEPISQQISEELALFPANATGVGYANMAAMRESPFFSMMQKRWDNGLGYSDEYQEFMEKTGLDLRKDINEVYFSIAPTEIKRKPSILVVIKGSYNPDKIIEFIESESKEDEVGEESYKDFTLYNLNNDNILFSFTDHNRLIFGNATLVKSWLRQFKEDKKKEIDSDLSKRLDLLKYKSGAWFVLDAENMIEEMMKEMQRHPEARRFTGLKSLKDFSFSMKVEDKLWFSGVGKFSDEEKAELFQDAVKGFISTMKLSVSEDRQAVDVLNKINVKHKGNRVMMDFEMSQEDIEKLQAKRPKIALK